MSATTHPRLVGLAILAEMAATGLAACDGPEARVLQVVLDLDIAPTARHLGTVPGTVRAHLSPAMAALRGPFAAATITEVER
jgi:hypothetical protein